MIGSTRLLGVLTVPWSACILASGAAWQLGGARFDDLLGGNPVLRRLAGRHLFALMAQINSAAACVHAHSVRARLARWLLMAQDRWASERITLTHEAAAGLLGVRRVSVALAAGELQRQGMIRYHRGSVEVRDRPRLLGAACGCYRRQRRMDGQLFGPQ